MQKRHKILFVISLFTAGEIIAAVPWINEFHYDDAGGDSGEFVEIVVPSSFTDLASVTLTLYNGGDGRSYASHALGTFSAGSTEGEWTFYSKFITGIQNGAPDGLALSWSDGTQFLSYEGSFVAANGPAAGLTSLNIGIAQPDTGAPDGSSLGLIGLGSRYDDFAWSAINTATPGSANLAQTVVPEPQTYVLMAAGGLGLFAAARARRRRAGVA
jgi:hypothetical protein